MREASRCLDCDTICSLCVGVCPNMALMTYEMARLRVDLPELAVVGGAVVTTGSTPFVVDQQLQIAVLTDFCNECGNCVTACPTSGRPYVDKPRLCLDRGDFEAQSANAFMLLGDGVIEGRFDGATHRLDRRTGEVTCAYWAPAIRAVLDATTFAVLEAEPMGISAGASGNGERISLAPAALMATLLAGVTGSLPHIPTAAHEGSRISHPGYAE